MEKSLSSLFLAVIAFILCLLYNNVAAQERSDTLGEIIIRDRDQDGTGQSADMRRQFTAGQQIRKIEAVYKDLYDLQPVSSLLAQQTPVFVRSYGINGLATLSLRGASAAQSTVLWNGVPIQNPALGVADLSLLNTGLFEEVSLQYGSSSALFGSGNVGGALLLDQRQPSFLPERKMSLTLGSGSFGRYEGALRGAYQNERWRTEVSAFYQQAENSFLYALPAGGTGKMENGRLKAGGVLLSADYNPGKKDKRNKETISLKLWYQRYFREIPPALFEQFSEKQQQDASFRSFLGWQQKRKQSAFYAKASLDAEYLRYQDGSVQPANNNKIVQYYQEAGWRWQSQEATGGNSGHKLMAFFPLVYAAASGSNISSSEYQFRPAVAAAYQFYSGRLRANVSIRQEWINGKAVPLLPGAGAGYRIFRSSARLTDLHIELNAGVQRTYRAPSLNELYYFPGGNRNLKPEQGWGEEAGYRFSITHRATETDNTPAYLLHHEFNFFNRNIDDWIYWLGGAIWTPYNIASVHSRGVETDNRLELRLGNIAIHCAVRSAYVLSTSEASYLPGDGSIGKQIPYTPRYNGQGNAGFTAGRFFVNYNHTYTGYRFVTIDESQFLKPYQTGNLQFVYTITLQGCRFKVAAQAQNIWNTRYEVVNARPMPGRHFQVQLQIKMGDE